MKKYHRYKFAQGCGARPTFYELLAGRGLSSDYIISVRKQGGCSDLRTGQEAGSQPWPSRTQVSGGLSRGPERWWPSAHWLIKSQLVKGLLCSYCVPCPSPLILSRYLPLLQRNQSSPRQHTGSKWQPRACARTPHSQFLDVYTLSSTWHVVSSSPEIWFWWVRWAGRLGPRLGQDEVPQNSWHCRLDRWHRTELTPQLVHLLPLVRQNLSSIVFKLWLENATEARS